MLLQCVEIKIRTSLTNILILIRALYERLEFLKLFLKRPQPHLTSPQLHNSFESTADLKYSREEERGVLSTLTARTRLYVSHDVIHPGYVVGLCSVEAPFMCRKQISTFPIQLAL